jgi:hypothetical protein
VRVANRIHEISHRQEISPCIRDLHGRLEVIHWLFYENAAVLLDGKVKLLQDKDEYLGLRVIGHHFEHPGASGQVFPTQLTLLMKSVSALYGRLDKLHRLRPLARNGTLTTFQQDLTVSKLPVSPSIY